MTRINTVKKTDYQRLINFLGSFQDEFRDGSFWKCRLNTWWDENPAFDDASIRGWIIEDGEQIVGFLGVIPTFFQLFGQQVIALNSTTWRVLPAYRDKSLSLIYHQIRLARNTLLFNTTPNDVVRQILPKLKFQLLPSSINREWIFIINFEKYLFNHFIKILPEKLVRSFIGKMVLKPAGFILSQIQSLRFRGLKKIHTNSIREFHHAGTEFDRLWEQTRNQYANTNVRTAAAINWYCFSHPAYRKIVLGYFKENQLQGYIVLHLEKQENILKCYDLWISGKRRFIIRHLVQAAWEYAQKQGLDAVRFPYFNPNIGQIFNSFAMVKTSRIIKKNYIKAEADILPKINEYNSYFVLIQGDLEI